MHNFNGKLTTFNYNPDFSGEVCITVAEGSIWVRGQDLLDFVAEYVRANKICQLENASSKQLLGLSGDEG